MLRVLTYLLAVAVLAANVGAAPASDTPSHPIAAKIGPPWGPRQATPGSQTLASKSPKNTTAKRAKVEHKARKVVVGQASWYGKAFQGKETASGEPYDMFSLTAAH